MTFPYNPTTCHFNNLHTSLPVRTHEILQGDSTVTATTEPQFVFQTTIYKEFLTSVPKIISFIEDHYRFLGRRYHMFNMQERSYMHLARLGVPPEPFDGLKSLFEARRPLAEELRSFEASSGTYLDAARGALHTINYWASRGSLEDRIRKFSEVVAGFLDVKNEMWRVMCILKEKGDLLVYLHRKGKLLGMRAEAGWSWPQRFAGVEGMWPQRMGEEWLVFREWVVRLAEMENLVRIAPEGHNILEMAVEFLYSRHDRTAILAWEHFGEEVEGWVAGEGEEVEWTDEESEDLDL